MPTPKQILEAVLFATDSPIGLAALVELLDGPDGSEVAAMLAELGREYEETERGVTLVEIAGGYQILSRRECAPWIDRMLRSRRKARLSRAGLETLAIVAYKQPITKVEIDSIRGVDSGGSLHTLLERNLVVIRGRAKGVGRPLLYSTSPDFLSYVGINTLGDLPELKELGPVLEERERAQEEIDLDSASELGAVGEEGSIGPAAEPEPAMAAAEGGGASPSDEVAP